jgi:cytochrome c-type biogenesis protein CcmH
MSRPHATFGVTLAMALSTVVFAQTLSNADPRLEDRVKALSAELRCLVCQNQTVADSDAPVARDMRDQVRAQLAAGKSESEVKQYMTERFGDFVLYKPTFKASTLALWIGPFLVLLIAAFAFVRHVRKRSTLATPAALTDAELARARSLLHSHDDASSSAQKPQ